jgi:hypothetical protein
MDHGNQWKKKLKPAFLMRDGCVEARALEQPD